MAYCSGFILLAVVDIPTNISRKVVYLIMCCVVLLQINVILKLQSQLWKLKFGI
jgi:hypothetical protein